MKSENQLPAKSEPSAKGGGRTVEESTTNPRWTRLASSPTLQPKLRVGAVDDPAEREADRVAEAVVSGGMVQRCSCEDEEKVQRAPGQAGGSQTRPYADVSPATESRVASLRGGGQPLTPTQRAYFEPHFGDLSAVRLHTDGAAAGAAREVSARAFTVGREIAFGAGEYQPDSLAGQKLLAHELTHTVQQGAAGVVRRQPAERKQPTLEEQAATIERILAREIVSAHVRGWDGVAFVVTHRGTWLEPTSMEKLGAQEQPPAGTRSLGETEAVALVKQSVATVLDAGKGASYRIVVGRGEDPKDRRFHLQSWRLLTKPDGASTVDPNEVTSAASEGECNESDSNYGECLVDERRRAYQEGILAAGQVAEAYYNPFSGGGGIPDFGAFKLWRLRRLRQVAQSRTRRHSGSGVAYRVIGPHGRLQGTSVYVLRDSSGTVLYVGKGETMNRLRSHISDPKKTQWFGEIAGVEVRATGLNNTQALALEETLVGQLKPLYNKDLTPFQKEFGSTLSVGANLPRSQQSLWFHVILGE